jgi:hypothetical protein
MKGIGGFLGSNPLVSFSTALVHLAHPLRFDS